MRGRQHILATGATAGILTLAVAGASAQTGSGVSSGSTAGLSSIGVLQQAFDSQAAAGFGLINADVNFLFNVLVTITITLTALLVWAWGDAETAIRDMIRRILLIGFVSYLINNWHTISLDIVDGLAALGLKAGGSSMSYAQFLQEPQTIAGLGFKIAANILNMPQWPGLTGGALGLWILTGIILLILALVIIFAMFWIAIEVFVTTLEFKIVTLASLIFIPFAVWQKTTFLSDRALGYVFSVGAKLMVLAIIVSIGSGALTNIANAPVSPPSVTSNLLYGSNWINIFAMVLAVVAVLMLALRGGAVAQALITGGPNLGAGSAAIAAGGAAALTAGAALAGTGVFKGLAAVASGGKSAVGRYAAGLTGGQGGGGGESLATGASASNARSSNAEERQTGTASSFAKATARSGAQNSLVGGEHSGSIGAPDFHRTEE